MFQIAKGPYDTLDFHFLKFRWIEELELGKGKRNYLQTVNNLISNKEEVQDARSCDSQCSTNTYWGVLWYVAGYSCREAWSSGSQ
jgi:hypothetical protein